MDSLPLPHYLSTIIQMLQTTSGQTPLLPTSQILCLVRYISPFLYIKSFKNPTHSMTPGAKASATEKIPTYRQQGVFMDRPQDIGVEDLEG